MELALLVYFARVVGTFSNLLGLFSFIMLVISVVFVATLLRGNLGVKQYGFETEDKLNNQLKIKKILTKSVKWTIPFAVIFELLSVLLPTERTVGTKSINKSSSSGNSGSSTGKKWVFKNGKLVLE